MFNFFHTDDIVRNIIEQMDLDSIQNLIRVDLHFARYVERHESVALILIDKKMQKLFTTTLYGCGHPYKWKYKQIPTYEFLEKITSSQIFIKFITIYYKDFNLVDLYAFYKNKKKIIFLKNIGIECTYFAIDWSMGNVDVLNILMKNFSKFKVKFVISITKQILPYEHLCNKYLQNNYSKYKKYSPKREFNIASRHGRMDVLRYLHKRYSEFIPPRHSFQFAASHGHHEAMTFINSLTHDFCETRGYGKYDEYTEIKMGKCVFNSVAKNGKKDTLYFIKNNFPNIIGDGRAYMLAAKNGHNDILFALYFDFSKISFCHCVYDVACSVAERYEHTDTLKILHSFSRVSCPKCV